LIGPSPTGDWASNANELTIWNDESGAWEFEASPPDGFQVTIEDEGVDLSCLGGSFCPISAKNSWDATLAPGSTDDSDSGYAVGSRWINTTSDLEYVCVDSTVGAAVWVETTAGAGSGEANTSSNAGSGEGTLAKAKNGIDLPIKSLKEGSGIALTNNADDVTIDAVLPSQDLSFSDGSTRYFETSSASYVVVGDLAFQGTDHLTPSAIQAIAWADSGATAGVRIYDVTNSQTIAEKTDITGTTKAAVDLGTLSNLSAGAAVWEVQLQRVSGSGPDKARISGVSVQF